MGFLDKLLKSETAKILTNAAGEMFEKISDDVLTTVKGAFDDSFPNRQETGEEHEREVRTEAVKEEKVSEPSISTAQISKERVSRAGVIQAKTSTYSVSEKTQIVCGKLMESFREEFSSYEIREQVSPAEINGREDARPYTYGVYQNGTPRLYIMVTDHNRQSRNEFYFAKKAAGNAGIPFLNFFSQFPNTPEYIKAHLDKYL